MPVEFLGTAGSFAHLAQSSPIWAKICGQASCRAQTESGYSALFQERGTIVAECQSSFDTLAELRQAKGLSAWDWVIVGRQHCGRGQYNRRWQSTAGDLLVSQLLPPLAPSNPHNAEPENALGQHHTLLPMLLAAALVQVLRQRGFAVSLKWPNDLVLFGQAEPLAGKRPVLLGKAGGLLIEQKGNFFALGLGLNLAGRALPALPPEESGLPALPVAFLLPSPQEFSQKLPKKYSPAGFDLLGLWQQCSQHLQRRWTSWQQRSAAELRAEVEAVLAFCGEEVEFFEYHRGRLQRTSGKLLGIADSGQLCLQTGAGLCYKMQGSLRPLSG